MVGPLLPTSAPLEPANLRLRFRALPPATSIGVAIFPACTIKFLSIANCIYVSALERCSQEEWNKLQSALFPPILPETLPGEGPLHLCIISLFYVWIPAASLSRPVCVDRSFRVQLDDFFLFFFFYKGRFTQTGRYRFHELIYSQNCHFKKNLALVSRIRVCSPVLQTLICRPAMQKPIQSTLLSLLIKIRWWYTCFITLKQYSRRDPLTALSTSSADPLWVHIAFVVSLLIKMMVTPVSL